jgi:hypothetical protein
MMNFINYTLFVGIAGLKMAHNGLQIGGIKTTANLLLSVGFIHK